MASLGARWAMVRESFKRVWYPRAERPRSFTAVSTRRSPAASSLQCFFMWGIESGYGVRWFLWKTYLLFFFMAGWAVLVCSNFSKKTLGYFLAALALTGIIAYNI